MSLEYFCFEFIHDPIHAERAGVTWQLNWPQWKYLDDNVVVYKYESDYNELEKIFGFQYSHTRHNASTYNGVSHTKETIDWINQFYKEDFLKYGYLRM
jgi:hypothetical protein